MPYSLVTQPLPEPFRNPGTPSSTVAVAMTRVWPASMRTLPSAVVMKSGVILMGRRSSGERSSVRKCHLPVFVARPTPRRRRDDSLRMGPSLTGEFGRVNKSSARRGRFEFEGRARTFSRRKNFW